MKTIEVIGKTIDEALKNALKELNLTEDKIDFEVIEEGSKGLFNFIGVKPAKIRVTVKKNPVDEAKTFLNEMLSSMGLKANVDAKEENDTIYINLTGEKMGLVIGYRGETLDAIQYLVSLVVNKNHENPY